MVVPLMSRASPPFSTAYPRIDGMLPLLTRDVLPELLLLPPTCLSTRTSSAVATKTAACFRSAIARAKSPALPPLLKGAGTRLTTRRAAAVIFASNCSLEPSGACARRLATLDNRIDNTTIMRARLIIIISLAPFLIGVLMPRIGRSPGCPPYLAPDRTCPQTDLQALLLHGSRTIRRCWP